MHPYAGIHPPPAYGYSRKRTESRRIEGPGRSPHIITHRHGSEYQKQSVYASARYQTLPSRYNSHGPRMITTRFTSPPEPQIHLYNAEQRLRFEQEENRRSRPRPYPPPPEPQIHPSYHNHPRSYQHSHHKRQPQMNRLNRDTEYEARMRAEELSAMLRDDKRSISSSSKVSSRDISEMDQRSPRGLKFGFSLARSSPDKNSSVSITQTLETSLGHDGVKGSKNIIEGDYKVYKENIFSVSSSRYTNFLDLRLPVEAELVLQPPAGPTKKSLSPLLTWM